MVFEACHKRIYQGYIMQTCRYIVDPLTPQFYLIKLGFTGVYIFFLFLL